MTAPKPGKGARVRYSRHYGGPLSKTDTGGLTPVAVIPCATAAQARRVVRLFSEPRKLREDISEEVGLAIATAYVRAEIGASILTDKREDYQTADKILALLGLTPPAK